MSRDFKYKTAEALAADARGARSRRFAPGRPHPACSADRGRGPTLGNRLAIQPMEGCDGETRRHAGELTFRRYGRFGGGGPS